MSHRKSKARTQKKAKPSRNRQKPSKEWRVIIAETGNAIGSSGWLQITVAIVLILIGPAFGVFMRTDKAIIIGTASGVTLLIWLVALVMISKLKNEPQPETEIHGYLVPANEPNPHNLCDPAPPAGAMLFYLGNSVFWQTEQNTYTVIRLLNPQEDLFTIRKTSKGIYLNITIRSRNGRIVAEIIDNEFHINPNNYYRRERPDVSSLTVYDQEGNAVLNVHYINATAIKILGVFNSPDQLPIVIQENRQAIPPVIWSANCQRIPDDTAAITIER